MIISEQWLKVWLDVDLTAKEIADVLTMAGLEISSIKPVSLKFTDVIVGEIKEVTPHPHTDKLFIYKVDVACEHLLDIISTEAIKVGTKLAVAIEGAILPSGKKVKVVELHGVFSQGVFCGEDLLGINNEESQEKLLIVEDTALGGQNCWDYFYLDDQLLELNITPNRGDCLSMLGVARELATLVDKPFSYKMPAAVAPIIDVKKPVSIAKKCLEQCPHYVGRVLQGVDMQQRTPIWLAERLRRAGVRVINPVVDVMNYVMLELGQPMHAFDLDKINGSLSVRGAYQDEPLTLLNEQSIKLEEGSLVIADDSGALALAGIMGGIDSAVTTKTTDIFLESALFNAESISIAARGYDLSSESSYRFIRGVDPLIQIAAIERATELLLTIVGGNPGAIIESMIPQEIPKKNNIILKRKRLNKVLGLKIDDSLVINILERLNFQPESNSSGWEIIAPSYRYDINDEIDVIEEIARVYGYNKIEGKLDNIPLALDRVNKQESIADKVIDRLASLGYQEVITYSFIDDVKQQKVFPNVDALKLSNPLSQEQSVMRTNGLIGLLNVAEYNSNRQIESMRFFEQGIRFLPVKGKLIQEAYLAGIMTGKKTPELWMEKQKDVDFFDIKGDLENLLQLINPKSVVFDPKVYPMLHPGQSASIKLDNKYIGFVGALHPKLQKFFGIKHPTFCFEVLFDIFSNKPMVFYQELSKFPVIRRDVAIVIEQDLLAQCVLDVVKEAAGSLLKETHVFDVYKGEGIDKNKKSIALALYLQHPMRTLVDKEVNSVVANVVSVLKNKLRATMRE